MTSGRGLRDNWVRYWRLGPWEIELEWVWLARYFTLTLQDTRKQP